MIVIHICFHFCVFYFEFLTIFSLLSKGGQLHTDECDSDEESNRRAAIRDIGPSQQNPDSRISTSPQNGTTDEENQEDFEDERMCLYVCTSNLPLLQQSKCICYGLICNY